MSAFPAKIEKSLVLLSKTPLSPAQYAPPFFTFLWWLGFAVPPPHFWGFWSLACMVSVFFGSGVSLLLVAQRSFLSLETIGLVEMFFVGSVASFVGLALSAYYARDRRRYRVPAWQDIDP